MPDGMSLTGLASIGFTGGMRGSPSGPSRPSSTRSGSLKSARDLPTTRMGSAVFVEKPWATASCRFVISMQDIRV